MSTHSPPLRQKISLLLFEQLVYPLFLKGGKEAQGKKAETARRTSTISQHLDSSPVLTKPFSWGRRVSGAASPERRVPRIRHTRRPCAAFAHHTDKSVTPLHTPVFPCGLSFLKAGPQFGHLTALSGALVWQALGAPGHSLADSVNT